jgi:hypothetical protein
MKGNVLFVLCGNCRTFIDCFDSFYNHVLSKLFSEEYTIHLYLYLKLTDPGPKGTDGWDFEYKDVDSTLLLEKIQNIKDVYPSLHIEHKILLTNEISDEELMAQVKARSLYTWVYSRDSVLLRGLHCHYNFEKCGNYIQNKEKEMNIQFDYIIYVRPDLFFTSDSNPIEQYDTNIVTLGNGEYPSNNDHIAIIPRKYLDVFFFERMNIYRNNITKQFNTPEEVYWETIPYTKANIGIYYIKRS